MFQKIIVSVMPALATGIGLFVFRKLTLFYRIILFQVMLYLFVLYLTYQVATENIHTVYNIYVPVETALLMTGGLLIFQRLKEKLLIMLSFVFFLMVYFIQVNGGLKTFANFASVVEGAIMMVIYLVILKNEFSKPAFVWNSSSFFWLCLGSAIYFGGTLPLLSIFNFANRNFLAENSKLFRAIVDVLANIRYLFVAISFGLFFKTNINALKSTA